MAVADDFDFEQMLEERAERTAEMAASSGASKRVTRSDAGASQMQEMLEHVPEEHKQDFARFAQKKAMEKSAADRVTAAMTKVMEEKEAAVDARLSKMDDALFELRKAKDGRYGEERLMEELDTDEDEDFDSDENEDCADGDVMGALRKRRRVALKRKAKQRQKWLENGHGVVRRLKDQTDWFAAVKSTDLVIALFSNDSNTWGQLLKEHLCKLAPKHLECKFIEMEITDAPFLCDRLEITMTPTLVLAKKHKIDRKLLGLDWVAPDGKIDTVVLEKKLYEYGFLSDTLVGLAKDAATVRKRVETTTVDDSPDELDLD